MITRLQEYKIIRFLDFYGNNIPVEMKKKVI